MAKCFTGSAQLQESTSNRFTAEREPLYSDMTFQEVVAVDDGCEISYENVPCFNEAEHEEGA